MNMPTDELKQALLEFHYDLLDDNEANTLRQRIASEPDVAAAWAETLMLAGKLASAAKMDGVQLPEIDKSKSTIDDHAANNGAVQSSVPGGAGPGQCA